MERKNNIMKRTLAGMIAVMCMAGCLPALAASAEESDIGEGAFTASEPVEGGWEIVLGSTAPEQNPDAVEALEKITKDIDGVAYTPVAVLARQCVAGMNYCILCKVKAVAPKATPTYELFYIYEDVSYNAEIIGRKVVLSSDPQATGGYAVNDGSTNPSDNEEELAAFDKALEGLGGMSYHPIAYLGSQTVAGYNHLFLCRMQVVYPDAEPEFGFVTVYEDLEGNARLNGSRKIDFGDMGEWEKTVHHAAKEPTCTKDGNTEYWYVPATNKYYSDDACENEISEASTVIKALGHELGEPEWIWSEDNTSAYLIVKCTRCGFKVVREDAVVTETVVSEPTSTQTGLIRYDATVETDEGTWTTSKEEVLPKLTTAPTISYEKGNGAVKLTWTEVDGAEKYGVAVFTNGKWQMVGQGEGTSYVLNNLKAGTEYKVAVFAKIGGEWIKDASNAITVSPKEAAVSPYPVFEVKTKDGKVGFKWKEVQGAEKYAVAVYQANKWVPVKQLDSNIRTWTSPQIAAGNYKVVVVAKVNGEWVTAQAPAHAVDISVRYYDRTTR